MDFRYLVNRTERDYTFGIYGEIGKDINGHYLAQELNYAGEHVDVINVRINSEGGSIMHGLSIFSALRNSTAKVNVFIDGVAASMAGVIAMAGDEISMVDYGRLMIHDPLFADKDELSDKEQKALDSIRSMLITIFEKRAGKDEAYLDKIMSAETWFTAKEAKKEGFINNIIKTDKKNSYDSLSVAELINKVSIENQNTEMENIKKIAVKIGLPETATLEEVIAKLEEMENESKPAEPSTPEDKLVASFIKMGEAKGVITEKNKDKFEKLAKVDMELAISLLDAEKPELPVDGKDSLRISDLIKELKSGREGGNDDPKKDYDWFQKNAPAELLAMKYEKPEDFKRLFEAKYGKTED